MNNNEKVITEQKTLIKSYELKLKDVVRAYKCLESEKKALETALTVFSNEQAKATTNNDEFNVVDNINQNEKLSLIQQVNALKISISTLTVESKKKENAFQNDRKCLIAKNEELTEEIKKLKALNNLEIERIQQEVLNTVNEKEKMLAKHGKIVSQMQQSYANEHRQCKQMEQKVTELNNCLQNRSIEVSQVKPQVDLNATTELLKQELINVKKLYEEELNTICKKQALNAAILKEKDLRIASLEARIKLLSEENVLVEQKKSSLTSQNCYLTEKLKTLTDECDKNKINVLEKENSITAEELIAEIRLCCVKIKKFYPNTDIRSLLKEYFLSDVQYSPHSTSQEEKNVLENNVCTFCSLAQQEITDLISKIFSLRCKLVAIEEIQCSAKSIYEKNCHDLQQKLLDLKVAQKHIYTEYNSKVLNLEDELVKQQSRVRQIIDEKNQEIENTRNNVMNFYAQRNCEINQKGLTKDPLDPKPDLSENKNDVTLEQNETKIKDKNKKVSDTTELTLFLNKKLSTLKSKPQGYYSKDLSMDKSLNFFYEQELVQRDQIICELRNTNRLTELNLRDAEQTVLTKDIQCLQMIETLKEEIRILQGKLSLEISETNMSYLRNIFIQFINSTSLKSRKHILKAIGAVLKLTANEMKNIETWNL